MIGESTNLVLRYYRYGNCRKEWKKMTKMNPSQLQVKDPIKKERRKEQAIRAFEAYQQRQTQLHPYTYQPPTTDHQPAHTQNHGGSNPIPLLSTSYRKDNPPYSKSTPNFLIVPPLSEVATPANSFAETQTRQFESYFATPLNISNEIAEPSASPGQAQSPAQTFILDEGRKRPAPMEFDLVVPASSRRRSAFHFNPSVGPEEIWDRSNSASTSNIKPILAQNSRADAHQEVDSKRLVKDRSTAVAELEDEMSVPRGFIDFFKYRLTITRASVASALSSSGSIRSRWSRKGSRQIQPDLPHTSHEPGREYSSQHPSSQDQAEHQWAQVVPPTIASDRANTDLFRKLQLAKSTDEEIASQLEALINDGANPNAWSPDGETPLHVALRLGNLRACQVLLDRGADVHVKTPDGKSLSEYGKIFQNHAGDDCSRYLAIKSCRHAIREHDPRQKATEASKLGTKIITHLDGHRHVLEPGGDSNGGSRMKAPHESILGELVGRHPPSVHEADFLGYGEDAARAVPSNVSPFLNINHDRWNTRTQATTARNLEGHYSATSGFDPDLQSIYDIPPIPYLDQTPAVPQGRNSPAFDKLVENFDSRESTKWSSVSASLQNTYLDDWNNQEPSLVHLNSGTQTLNEAIFHTPNTRSSDFEKTPRHRRASRTLNGQCNLRFNLQQSSQSLRHDFGLPLEPVLDSTSPT
jgi:hypothetical protein